MNEIPVKETIIIDDGPQTGDLVKEIISQLSDDEIDQMEVERKFAPTNGFASEPITISITIAASTALIIAVTRIIERWMENKRQDKARKMLLAAFLQSDEAGKAMKELEEKHADVSISYPLQGTKGKKGKKEKKGR